MGTMSDSVALMTTLRQFLTDKLSFDELDTLCFDYFPPVRRDFAPAMTRNQRVKLLLDWCEQKKDVVRLTNAVRAMFPDRYELYLARAVAAGAARPADEPEQPVRTAARDARQVFISHAMSADGEWAQRLADVLSAHGWRVWIAPNSLLPGEKWMPAIDRGLQESGVFILLMTQAAVDSEWVQDETYSAIELARQGKATFIPLRDPDEALSDIPVSWQRYQYVPFRREGDGDGLLALMTRLDPEKMDGLEKRYAQMQAALAAQQWKTAREIGAGILADYPDYRDVAVRMAQAESAGRHVQDRNRQLDGLYVDLTSAYQVEDWQRVLNLGEEILEIQQEYQDVEQRMATASERLQLRKQQAHLISLYAQMQAAVGVGNWREVLSLGERIQRTDADYKDVARQISLAREKLTPSKGEKESLPSWVWWGGAIVVLALVLWGVRSALGGLGGGDGDYEATATVAGVAAVVETATSTLRTTPTDAPTHALESTTTPTRTPRPIATVPTVPDANVPTSGGACCDAGGCAGDERVRNSDQMTMVYVPGGTFAMGSENGAKDERPIHNVTLDSFWIDRTEVTNAQYVDCVADGACSRKGYADDSDFNGPGHPVVGVTWRDAVAYCKWAGGRLPTEAEWEYAARGPDGNTYPWGEAAPTCELAQISDCADGTIPVGSRPPGESWVGAQDMAGNVWEWVNDWYGSDYYDNSPEHNPQGPESGIYKVLRGGSWRNNVQYVRSASRSNFDPTFSDNFNGFRCTQE